MLKGSLRQKITEPFAPGNRKRTLLSFLGVITGNALLAFGIAAFLMPCGILSDGTTGIGIGLGALLPDFDVAWLILFLNLLLLLIGFLFLGGKFFLTTVAGSVLYPLMLAGFERIPWIGTMTSDRTLAAIIGGIVIGAGMGLTIRVGSSTGGMDILAILLHKWIRLPIPVGAYIGLLGVLVIAWQAVFSDPETVLLSVLLLLLESAVIDRVGKIGKSGTTSPKSASESR